MSKKKKIPKLTDEQYYEYIMGLRDNAALFNADGEVLVPEPFTKENNEEKQGE